jgi:hypothetical protein
MKRQKLLSVAAIALLVAVTSCKKDNNSNNSQLSATIGGAAYNPSFVVGSTEPDYIDVYGVQAKSGDSALLSLSIPDTAHINEPITFDAWDLEYYNAKQTYDYASWMYGGGGTLTLSTYDKTNKKIAGKFSAVIYKSYSDSIVVSNGQFNTTYK